MKHLCPTQVSEKKRIQKEARTRCSCQRHDPMTYFLLLHLPSTFSHLPATSSYHESIKGLTHWSSQSPKAYHSLYMNLWGGWAFHIQAIIKSLAESSLYDVKEGRRWPEMSLRRSMESDCTWPPTVPTCPQIAENEFQLILPLGPGILQVPPSPCPVSSSLDSCIWFPQGSEPFTRCSHGAVSQAYSL